MGLYNAYLRKKYIFEPAGSLQEAVEKARRSELVSPNSQTPELAALCLAMDEKAVIPNTRESNKPKNRETAVYLLCSFRLKDPTLRPVSSPEATSKPK
ncbi:hypothetical protein FGIG_12517 [Fasciola gigantica]|uniref:Uncharacterized protein n=1 Tax=Fasciola gigantica TaxID=46835 RepID=A0A504WV38_FASGI|nr:hypothetical protein FGIG_12517 [Fasciola gigantica]